MFFDIGAGEVLGLAILGMMLVGPERLPKLAVEAAQWVKKIRTLASTATAELRENLGPGFEDLQPKDLNPKTFVKKQLSDLLDEEPAKPKGNRPAAMIDPDLL
ncbi:MAG: Sec-independent protein secretion pathway component [Acidobacteriota bacterium]|jgi:sec-independent protein translocase protein TatB|nr:Sec-independent protein secretion pathway component [Acidobacteriota bacterium]